VLPSPLTDLLSHDGFRAGAPYGVAAAAVVVLAAALVRRPLPGAGPAFGVAMIAAMVQQGVTVEPPMLAGLVLLAAGGYLATGRGTLVTAAAALPGAALFAWSAAPDGLAWALPTILAVTVVGGATAASFDHRFGPTGLPPVLLAVTALGIYLTTPDTEHSAILLGAAAPVALLGCPGLVGRRPVASLGTGGAFLAAALVAWVVALDGVGRDGAVVGGIACLGVFVLEPLTRGARHAASAGARPHAVLVGAVHVGVVVVCSRVAGLRDSAVDALVLCALAYAVGTALLLGGRRPQRSRPQRVGRRRRQTRVGSTATRTRPAGRSTAASASHSVR
jgi:hypothetical protein